MIDRTDNKSASSVFAEIAKSFAGDAEVSFGEGKGFGANALKVRGKIFAFISSKLFLVVKLPRSRVRQMSQAGLGNLFDSGHGRKMKEWLEYSGTDAAWSDLIYEARSFVGKN